jgi:hypothetical protein
METKDQLVKTIKEWVKIDNEIRSLQKEVNARKTEKKKMSETLIDIMKKNEIDCFDIKDGQICYTKKNIKQPITKKVLLSILTKYFSGDGTRANELNEFILENRQETVSENIVLKPLSKPL